MNINDLTIGQAKYLAALFGAESQPVVASPHIGKYCIIRAYASGVHAGILVSQNGRQVELKAARRLWAWRTNGGISLSEISVTGINQSKTKACTLVPDMTILDALEIIPTSKIAEETITSAPVAKENS